MPTQCAARKRIRRATTCVAPWHDDSRIQAGAIRLRSRFMLDGRPALVERVRHAGTPSFRTNPTARMERKAARSRRRNQRRSEYPGRSAIHVCNTTRCVSVFFHSLVPVLDTSDPLKRWSGRLHPRSRSRPLQPCKERTMLHAARPRGHRPGRGQASHPFRKRERFETETHRRWRPASSHRRRAERPAALQLPHIARRGASGPVRLALPFRVARHCGSLGERLGRPARASRKHASIRTPSAARSRCLDAKDSP